MTVTIVKPPATPHRKRNCTAQTPQPGRRRLLLAGVLAPLAAPALGADKLSGAIRRDWPAGRPTPGLDLPLWQEGRWSLAQARGSVVVVNFWASWCEPCRAEMPSLELLAARADGLQVVAVNFRETDSAIRRFLAASGLTLPVLRDADGAAAKAWQVRIFPSTVVVGRDGRAVFVVTGEVDWTGPQARAWIDAVLSRSNQRS